MLSIFADFLFVAVVQLMRDAKLSWNVNQTIHDFVN